MLSPHFGPGFSYPSELYDEMVSEIGEYILDVGWSNYDDHMTFLEDVMRLTQQQERATLYLLNRFAPEFFMVVVTSTDRVLHRLYSHSNLEEVIRDRNELHVRDRVVEYYRNVDSLIGKILTRYETDTGQDLSVLILSDHGFGPHYKRVYINQWLADRGWLVSKKGAWGRRIRKRLKIVARNAGISRHRMSRFLGTKGANLVKEMVTPKSSIDWSKTQAYSKFPWSISINLQGREAEGIVKSGREYEVLRTQIIREAEQLCDPGTGKQVVAASLRKEEMYGRGKYIDDAPDILLMTEGYLMIDRDVDVPSVFQTSTWRTGDHRMEGMFILSGRKIRRGETVRGARLIDLAPTILYLMGIPIPCDMDGKVLVDAFEPGTLEQDPPCITESRLEESKDDDLRVFTDQEVSRIEERLIGLGYL